MSPSPLAASLGAAAGARPGPAGLPPKGAQHPRHRGDSWPGAHGQRAGLARGQCCRRAGVDRRQGGDRAGHTGPQRRLHPGQPAARPLPRAHRSTRVRHRDRPGRACGGRQRDHVPAFRARAAAGGGGPGQPRQTAGRRIGAGLADGQAAGDVAGSAQRRRWTLHAGGIAPRKLDPPGRSARVRDHAARSGRCAGAAADVAARR